MSDPRKPKQDPSRTDSERLEEPSRGDLNSDLERTCAADPGAEEAVPGDLEFTLDGDDSPSQNDLQHTVAPGLPKGASADPAAGDAESTQVSDDELEFSISMDGESTLVRKTSSDLTPEKDDDHAEDSIEGFDIIEELGRGAFGIVYRARDLQLDRQVAIKVPLIRDPKLVDKYIQEARSAAQIDVPGIVPVFQVGSTQSGQPFVVQKLVEGSTLATIIERASSVPVSWAIDTIAKVATAIGTAHESGLVHRDLKPDNILIDRDGAPWIADFGLAVFEEDQKSLRGEVAGTPAYMAPEQLLGRADWLDGRADIWALGVILYKTLCGKLPFEAKDFSELQKEVLDRHPKPLSQRSRSLPSELDTIFNRCCAKEIQDRYPSAIELAEELRHVLAHSQLPMESIAIAPSADGSTTIRSRTVTQTQHSRTSLGKSTVAFPTASTPGGIRWLSLALLTLAIAGSIGFFSVWARLSDVDTGGSQSGASLAPSATSDSDALPSNPTAPVETRNILVSASGEGSHRSIGEAIKDAAADATIKIAPGIYRETLELTKNLKLIGQGTRDDVQIIGVNQAAITVTENSQVVLANLSVDSSGDDINTIELQSGKLQLRGCKLVASSFDCVRLHPKSELSATGCDFLSARHPALVAKQAGLLELDQCDFRFNLRNAGVEREDPAVAIELTSSPASVSNCTFTGTGKKGKAISNRDSQQNLLIYQCEFSGLLHGIELFRCQQANLTGVNQFTDCQLGIYAEATTAQVADLEILECDMGITLFEGSDFTFATSNVRKCSKIGIRVENSRASFDQCALEDNPNIAVMLDNFQGNQPFELENCSLRANQIGILLVAGQAEFRSGLVSQNTQAGIAVVAYESIPEILKRRSTTDQDTRRIRARETRINGKSGGSAILFNAAGDYQLTDCIFVDFENHNKPGMAQQFTTRQGTDGFTEVIPRER